MFLQVLRFDNVISAPIRSLTMTGHPKMQAMQTVDSCRLQTVQTVQTEYSFVLLRAQERHATLILTVTSGLRLTRARHVYNRATETGN